MKKLIFVVFAVLLSNSTFCNADYIRGEATEITNITAYSTGTVTGDIRIVVKNTVLGCRGGYYVNSENPGKTSILSIALSAFHTNTKVLINAYDTPRWAGSSHDYCLIEGIDLAK